ncbi:MAG: alpha/beta hydrolase [Deltaproteobacteria bacterium]|nr:MAG: alpha/beta hydrolase [Deltaproteobacteria bacterium]
MDSGKILNLKSRSKAPFVFIACLLILVGTAAIASLIQRNFGRTEISNVIYKNFNSIPIRAKLLKPLQAKPTNPLPGIVYIHGYQNNRETSDAYCIELARRGFVVLGIDAIGRGNSGIPNDLNSPNFDPTYGARSSLDYLKNLPFVNKNAIGLMGHSLGGEMAYKVALKDPTVRALAFSGFAYTDEATPTRPPNMLMIFGKYDEFRRRMTGTRDFEKEWMQAQRSRKVFPVANPQLGETYGDFAQGTARRVFMPRITHLHTSHNDAAIAEALEWMRQALKPPEELWISSDRQIWQIKEWATLFAMVACFAALLPLGLMLLRTKFFRSIRSPLSEHYACGPKSYFKLAALNGILMWLYLPLIFVLFGVHVYLVPIDKVFPMMMVNGIVWWLVWMNIIGFFCFRRWFKKRSKETGLTMADLGLSYQEDRFALNRVLIGKTILFAGALFVFAYLSEYILERIFIVDFRFVFPFASDLTPYRARLWLVYFPWILIGFLLMGIFLHGQLRRPSKETLLKTFVFWSISNIWALIVPLILFLLIQYIPLFTTGFIPFVGPGGMFIAFLHNLIHIVIVLVLVIPISTWFYQITGKIYLGAVLNAALVTWMFVSSQVIAPIPV